MSDVLKALSKEACDLSGKLFSEEEMACREQKHHGGQSCIQKEEDRPLTKTEKDKGWARRPFFAYDPDRMCNTCAAYFHAERAAQILHETYCLDVKLGAKDARQQVAPSET